MKMRDYNFFEIYEKQGVLSINEKSPLFIGIIIVLLVVVLAIGLVVRNVVLQYQINDYTEKTIKIKASREYIEANKIQNSISAMQKYDEYASIALEKFQASNLIGTEVLTRLSSSIPLQASLNSIRMNNGVMDASFNVADRKTAAELVLSLKESGLFKNVHLSSLTIGSGTTNYTAAIQGIMMEKEIAEDTDKEGEAE